MNQEQLIEDCRKLLSLVDNPEPGCATWHIACQEVAERIHAASAKPLGELPVRGFPLRAAREHVELVRVELPHATVIVERVDGRTYLHVFPEFREEPFPHYGLLEDRAEADALAKAVSSCSGLFDEASPEAREGAARALERAAAELRGVSKTCGNCKHWHGVNYGGARGRILPCNANKSIEQLGADHDCWFGTPENFSCSDWEQKP